MSLKDIRKQADCFSCQEHGRDFVADCSACEIPKLLADMLLIIDEMKETNDTALLQIAGFTEEEDGND